MLNFERFSNLLIGFNIELKNLFYCFLLVLKDRISPCIQLFLNNPPKPHSFTSLSLQSAPLSSESDEDKLARTLDYANRAISKEESEQTEDDVRVANFFVKLTDDVYHIISKPSGTLTDQEQQKILDVLKPITDMADSAENGIIFPVIRILPIIFKIYKDPFYRISISLYINRVYKFIKKK
jgi:hypothetical protein